MEKLVKKDIIMFCRKFPIRLGFLLIFFISWIIIHQWHPQKKKLHPQEKKWHLQEKKLITCDGILYSLDDTVFKALRSPPKGHVFHKHSTLPDTSAILNIVEVPTMIQKNDGIPCVPSNQSRSVQTQICIHDLHYDRIISLQLCENGTWEEAIHKTLIKLLEIGNEYGLIDIGANIGSHSIDIAKMGRKVVAVEPVKLNVLPLQKSVRLNNIESNFIIVNNAVSNTSSCVNMTNTNGQSNQGAFAVSSKSSCNPGSIRTITISDLLEVMPFDHAVIKIDVEGYEPQVFQNATYFFSKINVSAVFMEFLILQRMFHSYDGPTPTYVDRMVDFFVQQKFHPYYIEGTCLLTTSWTKWPENILWLRDYTLPLFSDERKVRPKFCSTAET